MDVLGGLANEALIYAVTVTNNGSQPDSFSLAVSGAWPAALSDMPSRLSWRRANRSALPCG
ncbi:MAG: hypothetical protein R2911_35930 [Caldilineaceae bacterium]